MDWLRFRSAAVGVVAAEVRWFQWIFPRSLHQVRLGGLLQLRQDETATALRRAVHLEHLHGKGEAQINAESDLKGQSCVCKD